MKSGVILVLESGMKKRELYNILIDNKVVFGDLGQSEYFTTMEDLSIQYYQTGSPHPDTIKTETYLEENGENV